MARVLASTPPQVVEPASIDTQQALAWLQAHVETAWWCIACCGHIARRTQAAGRHGRVIVLY